MTLIAEAKKVPSGVVRLMELQEQGWSYIRPKRPERISGFPARPVRNGSGGICRRSLRRPGGGASSGRQGANITKS